MRFVSEVIYVDFVLKGSSGLITGKTLSTLQIIFLRNLVACTDSLSLVEPSPGKYVLSYTASAAGHDSIFITDTADVITIVASEDIYTKESFFGTGSVISITPSYSGISTSLSSITSLSLYSLFIFKSIDWDNGLRTPNYAVTTTELTSPTDWGTNPLYVSPNTYTIALIDVLGNTIVIKSHLAVS